MTMAPATQDTTMDVDPQAKLCQQYSCGELFRLAIVVLLSVAVTITYCAAVPVTTPLDQPMHLRASIWSNQQQVSRSINTTAMYPRGESGNNNENDDNNNRVNNNNHVNNNNNHVNNNNNHVNGNTATELAHTFQDPGFCERVLKTPTIDVDVLSSHQIKALPDMTFASLLPMYHRHNDEKLRNFIVAAENQEPTAVLVFGGSETAGHRCKESGKGGAEEVECTWSHRVAKWLHKVTGNENIQYKNMARGGTSSISVMGSFKVFLQQSIQDLPVKDAKLLVFLDYAMNDSLEAAESLGAQGISLNTGLRYALEVILKAVKDVSPDAAVFALQSMPNNVANEQLVDKVYTNTYNYHRTPYVHLPDVEANGRTYWHWQGQTHPRFDGHIFMANIVTHAFASTACPVETAEDDFREPDVGKLMPICDPPLTVYSSHSGTEIGGDCVLTEDVPGKPGYICTGDQVLRFKVTFGKFPTLLLTYLQSYENIDTGIIEINDISYPLVPKSGEHTSQSHTVFYHADADDSGQTSDIGNQGFEVESFSTHEVTIRPKNGGKVKIMLVLSC